MQYCAEESLKHVTLERIFTNVPIDFFFITIEPMLIESLLNPQGKWLQEKMSRLIRYKGRAALEMEFAQKSKQLCKMQTFF